MPFILSQLIKIAFVGLFPYKLSTASSVNSRPYIAELAKQILCTFLNASVPIVDSNAALNVKTN